RQVLERRNPWHGRLHRRDRRRLQPDPRRDRRWAAARRGRQHRRGLCLDPISWRHSAVGLDRGDPGAAARPLGPRRGAHGMTARNLWIGVALVAAVAALAAAPYGLRNYGISVLSMWAVTTIAAIGLNLTVGYAGQVSLAQGAFVGIGAYATAILMAKGVPFAG